VSWARSPDRHQAERRLNLFLTAVERAQLPAFTAFAAGVRLWRTELLAYFDKPTTNGYAEGVINKVKVIKRRDVAPERGRTLKVVNHECDRDAWPPLLL
jgi:transposase